MSEETTKRATQDARDRIHQLTKHVELKCGKCPKRKAIAVGNGCLARLNDAELVDYFEAVSWLWYGKFLELLSQPEHEPDNGYALLQLILPLAEFFGHVRSGKKSVQGYQDGLMYIFDEHKKADVEKLGKTMWGNLRGNMAHQLLKTRHVRLDAGLRNPFECRKGVQGYDPQAWVATINATLFSQYHWDAIDKYVKHLRLTPSRIHIRQFREYMTKGGTSCPNP